MDGNISMSCLITGKSNPAPEGGWVEGGRFEIPSYVDIRKGKIELKKDLKIKLSALK